jgi:ligand-binding SRPBCC domain-containing protein
VKVLPGVKLTWVTEILQVDPGHYFIDAQESGPFRFWRHRHEFLDVPGGTEVRDTVHWALPLDPFSRIARPFVRKQLDGLFAYRAQALPAALQAWAEKAGQE